MQFLEEEKVKFFAVCENEGIPIKSVEELLENENVPDFDLDNLKLRLGIVTELESPSKRRKPV